jgi:UDP-N-acetylmuramyl pentapeptide phosphotransferase/UDP-N-acetylglucosamine-1-phosphate transferase
VTVVESLSSPLARLLWVVAAALLAAVGAQIAGRAAPKQLGGGRHLHGGATARGGGVGIALAAGLGLALLAVFDARLLYLALGLACAAIAGLLEDLRGLHPAVRLLLHAAAAVLMCISLLPDAELAIVMAAALAVVAIINLSNFMDGANGLLALQAMLLGVFGLSLLDGVAAICAAFLLGGGLGFLPFNFPRARVFLGDVGSYSLGYLTGALAIFASMQQASVGLPILAVVLVLLADAIFTLGWRVLSTKRIFRAHREHLFQWQIRAGRAHATVSLALLGLSALAALSLLTLPELPWAQGLAVLVCLALLLLLCWALGRLLTLRTRRRGA